jgi:hypothetical protein
MQILFAISTNKVSVSKTKLRFPEPGSQQQLVAVSYDGCKALSKSLYAVIFAER